MTYDVKLGPTHVITVTTDEDAAHAIAAVLESCREHLYRWEGLEITVVKSDREPKPAPAKKKASRKRSPRKKAKK